jgi:predicted nucleic acid-binding protein
MRLIDELEGRVAREQSVLQAQLLREDIARLKRLQDLARTDADITSFRKAALQLGWTRDDARTHELTKPLDALLIAVHAYVNGATVAAQESSIGDAWRDLHRLRMERLVGCLSTPVPRPLD